MEKGVAILLSSEATMSMYVSHGEVVGINNVQDVSTFESGREGDNFGRVLETKKSDWGWNAAEIRLSQSRHCVP